MSAPGIISLMNNVVRLAVHFSAIESISRLAEVDLDTARTAFEEVFARHQDDEPGLDSFIPMVKEAVASLATSPPTD